MQKLIHKLALNPKVLFLVDGLGALLTALCLLAIGLKFNLYFGMPHFIFSALSLLAFMFSFYSISCFVFVKHKWRLALKIISVANLLYCCLTLALLVYHFQLLKALDLIYFISEILIICALVFLEREFLVK